MSNMNVLINKNLKIKIIILIFIFGILYVVYKKQNTGKCVWEVFDANTFVQLKPVNEFNVDDLKMKNLVITGLTYDLNQGTCWICDYGIMEEVNSYEPAIIEVSNDFSKVLHRINLTDILPNKRINLQGISYDVNRDSFWLTDGVDIYNISKKGTIEAVIDIQEKYEKYQPNGVYYNAISDSVWVLFYKKFCINYTIDGNIIEIIKCNFLDQDHICGDGQNLLISVGADYRGNRNYILRLNLLTKQFDVVFQPQDSYAIEGMALIDDKLYVANDGAYHSSTKDYNYVMMYDWNREIY